MFRLEKENFCRGTPPPPSKGKKFGHQIWLDTCSDWEKKFLSRDPPPSPRIARNCYGYAAGGMPLAFTQEDFLVPFRALHSMVPRQLKCDQVNKNSKIPMCYFFTGAHCITKINLVSLDMGLDITKKR